MKFFRSFRDSPFCALLFPSVETLGYFQQRAFCIGSIRSDRNSWYGVRDSGSLACRFLSNSRPSMSKANLLLGTGIAKEHPTTFRKVFFGFAYQFHHSRKLCERRFFLHDQVALVPADIFLNLS
jgi:hypothetical protein